MHASVLWSQCAILHRSCTRDDPSGLGVVRAGRYMIHDEYEFGWVEINYLDSPKIV